MSKERDALSPGSLVACYVVHLRFLIGKSHEGDMDALLPDVQPCDLLGSTNRETLGAPTTLHARKQPDDSTATTDSVN